MSNYPDLEIGLHRREGDAYSIDLRFSHRDDKGETRPIQGGFPGIPADLAKFRQLIGNPAEYGRTLWTTFFGEPKVKLAVEPRAEVHGGRIAGHSDVAKVSGAVSRRLCPRDRARGGRGGTPSLPR